MKPNPLSVFASFGLVGCVLLGASTPAAGDTFYLQAKMNLGDVPTDDSLWFTQPTGGSPKPASASFADHSFEPQSFSFRAENTRDESTFPGHLSFLGPEDGSIELLTGEWTLAAGAEIDTRVQARLRQAGKKNTIAVENGLHLGSRGSLLFRTFEQNGANELHVTVDELSGRGELSFGAGYDSDKGGLWGLSVERGSDFLGVVRLSEGSLSLGPALELPRGELSINDDPSCRITLEGDLKLSAVVFGDRRFADAGTHRAADLNQHFGTRIFVGRGSVELGAEPEPSPADASGSGSGSGGPPPEPSSHLPAMLTLGLLALVARKRG